MNADVVVIGSGQGGTRLAMELAKRGRHVVLFERENVGGSCINVGCTPSKAFLAAAHSAGRARRSSSLGVHAVVGVDFPFVMDRVRSVVGSFRTHLQGRMEEAGVEIVFGEATFTGEHAVRCGDVEVASPIVVINTGTSPAIPSIEGLADTPYLTNKSFFSQTALPERCIVLGGGYIGLELGQGLARVGSKVEICHHRARILNMEEEDVSALLSESLNEDGVKLNLNARAIKATFGNGVFRLQLDDGSHLEGEQLLVAVGRQPNTRMLHVERSGVALDERGYVKVDAQLRTSCAGVYAIGEVSGQPAFTHVSYEDHRRLLSILDGGDRTRDDRVLGYAIYTEPQVGRAGLTFEQARARGINARRAEISLSSVMRAVEWGQERGFYRMVVDQDTDKIIGATLAGYEAAEIVHVFIALMHGGATSRSLAESIYIHPTYCEGLQALALLYQP